MSKTVGLSIKGKITLSSRRDKGVIAEPLHALSGERGTLTSRSVKGRQGQTNTTCKSMYTFNLDVLLSIRF